MEQIAETFKTPAAGFDLGTWLGRNQAFSLVAGRCSTALAECLLEIKENKRYLALEDTWEAFCEHRLGMSRATADRIVRQYRQMGAGFAKLNSFVRIKPSEYRLIAEAVTEDGLLFDGEIIPLDVEHTPQLAQALQALHRENTPEPAPADSAAQSFAKAERLLEATLAEFERLQAMDLDEDGRLHLVIALEGGRDHLDRLRDATIL
jgi:hypothetical protein